MTLHQHWLKTATVLYHTRPVHGADNTILTIGLKSIQYISSVSTQYVSCQHCCSGSRIKEMQWKCIQQQAVGSGNLWTWPHPCIHITYPHCMLPLVSSTTYRMLLSFSETLWRHRLCCFSFPKPHPFCFLTPWHPLVARPGITITKRWIVRISKPRQVQFYVLNILNMRSSKLNKGISTFDIRPTSMTFKYSYITSSGPNEKRLPVSVQSCWHAYCTPQTSQCAYNQAEVEACRLHCILPHYCYSCSEGETSISLSERTNSGQ